MEENNDYKEFETVIKEPASEMSDLHNKAKIRYTPIVNNLIHTNNRNRKEIENILDELLNFATDENILKLFKDLCRYYYSVDPIAASEYVFIYREMWNNNTSE